MPVERQRPALAGSLWAFAAGACADDPSITNYCPADVVINEIAASSGHDWIELYNADDEALDLGGFYLWSTDYTDDGFTLPATTLASHDFLVLSADTYEADNEPYIVLMFDLNRDAGHLELDAPAHFGSAPCDVVNFPDQHDNYDWARQPDGGDEWCDAAHKTKGTTNVDAGCLCGPEDTSPWC